jgi:hypothetical protein
VSVSERAGVVAHVGAARPVCIVTRLPMCATILLLACLSHRSFCAGFLNGKQLHSPCTDDVVLVPNGRRVVPKRPPCGSQRPPVRNMTCRALVTCNEKLSRLRLHPACGTRNSLNTYMYMYICVYGYMCIHVCTSTSSKGMLKNIISKAGTEGLSGIERYTSCTSTSYLKQPMLYVQSVVEYYTNYISTVVLQHRLTIEQAPQTTKKSWRVLTITDAH